MILESDFESPAKAVHILDLGAQASFSVGRRINNDISITDISVSRVHAMVIYVPTEGKVFLQDSDSKFGTFKQVPSEPPLPIKFDKNSTLPIQIEKKCFFFQLEPRFTHLQRLCVGCFQKKSRSRTDMLFNDFFLQQFNKFPLSARKSLMTDELPKLRQIVERMTIADRNNKTNNLSTIVVMQNGLQLANQSNQKQTIVIQE